ncbi:unnamed protein product, partial [Mesorhabditis belari]|uniref:Uncharacterized protein n=1 Tax=Mesorhabditis belari TaxID=2138241 RepID=A0AAF3EW51_9BILA
MSLVKRKSKEFEQSSDCSSVDENEETPKKSILLYKVNDYPPPIIAVVLAFQQWMVALSGYFVTPFLVADIVCAGKATPKLRVNLMASTFVSGGIASFVQATFGVRLAIVHGHSLQFLAPLLAYGNLPENACKAGYGDDVPEEEWHQRIAMFSGSMLLASLFFFLIGLSGAVGIFARFVGPITIVPLLTLLAIAVVPTIEEKLTSHYMAVVELVLLVIFAMYMENIDIPFPYYSFKEKKFKVLRAPLIGQFSFMLGMLISWFICWILTASSLIDDYSPASTNNNATSGLVSDAPWFKVPYPGEYGAPKLDTAMCIGYGAAVLSQIVENVGSYKMGARVSEEGNPPRDAVNRGIMVEGFGSIVASIVSIPIGVTTFAGNIALLQFTRVVSRVTVQLVGIFFVFLGLFTKFAAVFASIPDPLVGGILCLSMSAIAGVALSNLRMVNLNQTRNLAIMGLALIVGITVPKHFTKTPVDSGNKTWDQVFNMLLNIEMLVGGGLAFILDNTVPGASRADRGLVEDEETIELTEGFWMPEFFDRWLNRMPALRKLPFMPSKPNPGKFSTHDRSLSQTTTIDEELGKSYL